MRWPSELLGQLKVELQTGFACRPSHTDGGVRQLRTHNVSPDGHIDLSSVKTVHATPEQVYTYALRRGDILFNNTNSPALVGKTAYFDETEVFVFSNHMTRIRVKDERLDARFLAWFLHWSWQTGRFRTSITQWVNQAAINKAELARLRVPLPDLAEQRRVVEIIEAADRLKRRRSEADTTAARVLPAIYHRMFAQNEATWPLEPLASRLRRTQGALQSGPFGTQLHNSDFTSDGPVHVVGIDNVLDGEFITGRNRRISWAKYEELKRFMLEPGDVLITIMGTVGRTCVFPGLPAPAICTKHVYRIQVDPRLTPEYVSSSLRFSPEVRAQLGTAQTGQIVSAITSDDIRRLQLRIPPRALQDQYVVDVKQLADVRDNARRVARILRNLFDTVLAQAFDDEPSVVRSCAIAYPLTESEHDS